MNEASSNLSITSGIPLSEEPGLGTLTISAFLREVTERFADREAMVMHTPDVAERWSYADLWERSVEVARALLACGVGKGGRVGIMMTNRLEWVSAFFGTALAGGVATTFSTFSTAPELEQLVQMSDVSVLLLEGRVLKKDFVAILEEREPALRSSAPGALRSTKFPFLRHLAVVGMPGNKGAIESWDDFLARGAAIPPALVDAAAATVHPADPGALFFSSGSTSKPKGILSAHRGVAIQMWRWQRMFALQGDVRCWTANGFFWSGNFGMALGATFGIGGSVVLQATFDPVEAIELMQAEKVNFPLAWPHQWAQLQQAPNWNSADLSNFRFIDVKRQQLSQPTLKTDWTEPDGAYGNTETFTISTSYPSLTPREITGGEKSGEPLPGMTIKIVDPLSGAILPRGERGEIGVKGATMMLGYIGIPLDETLDEEGFLLTGDGGYIDEKSRLVWEGRLTDIIKTGGANVSPAEIDEVMATITGVKLSQTVGVPHDTLGEMVVACIIPQPGAVLDESEIRDFLKQRLASYKVPRRVLFLDEDEVALTGSNKVKTGVLREFVAKRLAAEAEAA